MKIGFVTCILLLLIMAGNSNVRLLSQGEETSVSKSDTTPAAREKKENKKSVSKKADEVVKTDKATITTGLELIGNSDCTTCHKIAEKFIGPSYKDVAAKYKATRAIIDTLVKKIIEGGTGVWGPVPMTPHPGLSNADAQKMVQCILSMK